MKRRFRSDLLAAPEDVWRVATSISGINAELMPLISMHNLDNVRDLSELVTNSGIARIEATIRLASVIPIGRVMIELVELAEFRFVERSNQPGMRFWQHEREVVPSAAGCAVVDNLTFEPRAFGPVSAWLIDRLFRHRHRRLRARWGAAAVS